MHLSATPLLGSFDIRVHRVWGAVPLLALAWHGTYTVQKLDPGYLLFVCYAANLLLGVGILTRSGLLTGTAFCWIVVGYPLWLYDVIRASDWEPSGLVFHTSGLLIGALTMRYHLYPRYAWLPALGMGATLQVLARWFTSPTLNVNAAFRVYEGWEALFNSMLIYRIVMLVGFGTSFAVLILLNRRFTCIRRGLPSSTGA
jgi:hypothetical protein